MSWVRKYGREWAPIVHGGHEYPAPDLMIDLAAFANLDGIPELASPDIKEQAFRGVVEALWHKGSNFEFIWHPWAERMLKAACRERYLGVAGCASSGKSSFFAAWAIVNFLAAPRRTQVIVASTQLSLAKKRIWRDVQTMWSAIPEDMRPGKMIPSLSVLVYQDPDTGERLDGFGITLVAADKSHGESAKPKLIGIKAARVLLILDELPDLSPSMLDAASNLSKNPYFQMIGLGNPDSYFDAFGRFVKPAAGWDSLTESDEEWRTELGGLCLRFDGEKSPNVLAGEALYPFLITQENLDEDAARYGGKLSAGYYRMNRGYFRPTGRSDAVYTEQEILESHSMDRVKDWVSTPTKIIFLDPSFTNGGDRCLAKEAFVGLTRNGKVVLELGRTHLLTEDTTNKTDSRTMQIARQFADIITAAKINPRHVGLDATAGGGPFGDVLAQFIGPNFFRLNLAGNASDKPVSTSDSTPANRRYRYKVTEVWYGAKELLRTGQIKGIDPDLVKEMVARTYRLEGQLVQVEDKKSLRRRIGRSCDLADAALGVIALAKERCGLGATGVRKALDMGGQITSSPGAARPFPSRVWRHDDNDPIADGFGGSGEPGWGEHQLGSVPAVFGIGG